MANPILVTGAAGRVGAVGRTVTELLLKQGKTVRALAREIDKTIELNRLHITKTLDKVAASLSSSPLASKKTLK